MQYRIQFLDGEACVIRELSADARSAINALPLVGDLDWPPRVVTVRVLDAEGREVYSEVQGDASEHGALPQNGRAVRVRLFGALDLLPPSPSALILPRARFLLARGFFVWRLGGRFVWGAVVA
jgi:hypothetical protein